MKQKNYNKKKITEDIFDNQVYSAVETGIEDTFSMLPKEAKKHIKDADPKRMIKSVPPILDPVRIVKKIPHVDKRYPLPKGLARYSAERMDNVYRAGTKIVRRVKRAMGEETLNELSPGTLRSYISKAIPDKKRWEFAIRASKQQKTQNLIPYMQNKAKRRAEGAARAERKLYGKNMQGPIIKYRKRPAGHQLPKLRESILNELSPNLLGRYIKKAIPELEKSTSILRTFPSKSVSDAQMKAKSYWYRKTTNRVGGINRARGRLSGIKFSPKMRKLKEVSNPRLVDYLKKAIPNLKTQTQKLSHNKGDVALSKKVSNREAGISKAWSTLKNRKRLNEVSKTKMIAYAFKAFGDAKKNLKYAQRAMNRHQKGWYVDETPTNNAFRKVTNRIVGMQMVKRRLFLGKKPGESAYKLADRGTRGDDALYYGTYLNKKIDGKINEAFLAELGKPALARYLARSMEDGAERLHYYRHLRSIDKVSGGSNPLIGKQVKKLFHKLKKRAVGAKVATMKIAGVPPGKSKHFYSAMRAKDINDLYEEEVVQELSIPTMLQYVSKARKDFSKGIRSSDYDRVNKRLKGINLANKKIDKKFHKEESQPLNELSKRLLARYIYAARQDVNRLFTSNPPMDSKEGHQALRKILTRNYGMAVAQNKYDGALPGQASGKMKMPVFTIKKKRPKKN
jgi:hypothetical protein